jgi:hypothetical protein
MATGPFTLQHGVVRNYLIKTILCADVPMITNSYVHFSGQTQVVEFLVSIQRNLLNDCGNKRTTPLLWAALKGMQHF